MAPDADQVHMTLRRSWQCNPGRCIPVGDAAWQVDIDVGQLKGVSADARFVAKWVQAGNRRAFHAGLSAAEHVEAAGIASGCPVRAADGALTVAHGDGVLALLRLVPGRPLCADDPLDQQWWGGALGAVHRCLRQFVHPDLAKFQAATVPADGPHFTVEPWLRPAVEQSVAVVRRIMVTDQLTYGVRHGGPAAVEFRLDGETGRVGLTRWTEPGTGPLLYDVACAVLSTHPSAADGLIEAYRQAGPVPADECDAALPALLDLRAALLATRLAAKIAEDGGTPRDHTTLTHLATLLHASERLRLG